ncbi:MAG TPA: DUF1844 domain-containing protein [Blastocatellia bacterium]|nr:DUF1844 domain-containing protein [Blastocatellia bacterium]
MAEQKDTGFKITDRRKFNADGSPREGAEEQAVPAPSESPTESAAAASNVISFPNEQQKPAASGPAQAPNAPRETTTASPASAEASPAQNVAHQQAERAYDQHRGPTPADMPEASFVGLLNMLALECELALGLIARPGEEAPDVNLEVARHLIDTLGMLKNKTRENLNAQEQNLLDEILAYLRMQFVQVSRGR